MLYILIFYSLIFLIGIINPLYVLWILCALLFVVPSDLMLFLGSTPATTIGIIGFITLFLKKHSRIKFYNKWSLVFFVLLITYALLSYLFHSNYLIIGEFKNSVLGIIEAYFFFVFALNVLDKESNISLTTTVFLILPALGGYLAFIVALRDPSLMYSKAFFGGNPNTYAYTLLVWLPISVNHFFKCKKLSSAALYLISSLGIIAGIISTSGVMSVSITISYLVLIIFLNLFSKRNDTRKRSTILLLVIIFSITIINSNTLFVNRFSDDFMNKIYYGDQNRQLRNQAGLTLFKSNPLFGTGPGGFKSLSTTSWREIGLDSQNRGGSMHNIYLSILVDFGGIGCLIIFLFFLSILLKDFSKVKVLQRFEETYRGCITGVILFFIAGFAGGDIFNLQFWIIISLFVAIKIISENIAKQKLESM